MSTIQPKWVNIPKSKYDAIVAPGQDDDSSLGYSEGSIWVDLGAHKAYICVDATEGAAVWQLNSKAYVTNCDSSVAVGDAVFLQDENLVNKALATSYVMADIIGFVTKKISSTICEVESYGVIEFPTTLVSNKTYFLSIADPGKIIDSITTGTGKVLKK